MQITIRKGGRGDLEEFITFLAEVREGMAHKEWFYLDPPEDVRDMMDRGILELWVAMDGDKMAGALDILCPGTEEFNYGYDLNYTHEELLRVVNMDTAAVRAEYRGMGLQRKLIQAAEEALAERGNRILLCTVHPDNQFSLRNVLKQGYEIQKKVEKYGSVRYVLRKDMK